MSNTPKLRFPEFKGEWEEKRLEEICDPPKYGLNSAGIEFDGIHKYLRITDIDEITHTFSPTDITTPSEFNDEYLLNKNDIVFARTGASTGKTYLYDSNDGDLYFAGFLIKFHVKDANARFVFYQTLTHKYSKWVHVMSTRSGQPGINSEEYGSYKIKLPDIHEQQKIADFLSNVDSIITAETKILNALQKKKKALMQKLFTQQLRFKSANGTDFPAWEDSTLERECDYVDYRGKTPKKVSTGIFLVTAKNIKLGYIDYDCSKEYIAENDYNEVMHRGKVKLGDVLITTEAPCGNVAQIDNENVALAQRVIKYSSKGRLNNTFLKYYFLSDLFRTIINEKATGSTVKGIKGSVLHKQKVIVPSLEEQQKIADCLSSMDSLIQTQQKVVTTWQQRKKALLQQMFI